MKKNIKIIVICIIAALLSSCSLKTNYLEDAKIYTTSFPINYLANELYGDRGSIQSIYPLNYDIKKHKITEKQLKEFAKSDLFIYNGLTKEKTIAKNLLNKNNELLIIDVSYGITLENDISELWLNPKNYLMLAKNIKNNLEEYIQSKYVIEEIDKNYEDIVDKISSMEAKLYELGRQAKNANKNIIVTSNSTFKFLESYGYKVIALDNANNLKENKLKAIQSNFDNKKYTYILVADIDKENETVKDLIANHGATEMTVDTLTNSLQGDYFDIMTDFTEKLAKFSE